VPSYLMVGIAEVSLLKNIPDFCLVSVHLKPFKTCILLMEFVQLELQTSAVFGVDESNIISMHNRNKGIELNPGQWQHLSAQTRTCPCHCYKGEYRNENK